jgi:hypothetical protein
MPSAEAPPNHPLGNGKTLGRLIFLMAVRTLVNTLHRMVYPLPVFSRELGISGGTRGPSVQIAAGPPVGFFSAGDSRGRNSACSSGWRFLEQRAPSHAAHRISSRLLASLGKSLLDT